MTADRMEFQRLQRNLTALIDFSHSVNSNLDLNFTLNNLLLSCLGKFHTTKGFIALQRGNELIISISKGLTEEQLTAFPLNVNIEEPTARESIKQYCHSIGMTCEPIAASRTMIGFIALGEKMTKSAFTDNELEFLRTILNIAATAIQNSFMIDEMNNVNRRLDSRVQRLSSLFELSKEFGLILEEERIGKLLLYSLLGHFLVSVYAIIYISDKNLRVLQATIPKKIILDKVSIAQINSITDNLCQHEILTRLPGLSGYPFSIAIPMMMQNETRGLILLGRKADNSEYSTEDFEFVNSLGSLAVVSLENRRLFKAALEKQRLEEELEIAKGIQQNLLPKTIPQFPGLQIAAITIPSKHIGGDYYDLIQLDENDLCIAIADVSGKGVPAALLMANLQAFLKSICKQKLPITEATDILNNLINENTSDGRFITFFWTYFDIHRRRFNYVNAGHNPPLLVRNGQIKYLDHGGLIFGVMKTTMPYETEEVTLLPGDCLVLFTDGVTEAKDDSDNEYTDHRLEQLILTHKEATADEILEVMIEDINEHSRGCPQSDDITIVIIKAL